MRREDHSSVEIEGTCVSKNFDETVCLQSKKSEEWIREIKGERLQRIAKAQVALPVWLADQPRRSPGETSVPEFIVVW